MAEPPKLAIRRRFPRPEEGALAPFRDASTGWVADARGRRGALDPAIRPLTRRSRFLGPALTVRTRPLDNLAAYAALPVARPGDVLVVATDAAGHGAVLGDVLVGMARNAGIVAVVTDGLVRDLEGLDAVGIPVFARALSPGSPFKDGPGAVGVPVVIGGQTVAPGDLLVGDADGVVHVPREDLAAIGAALAAIARKEAAMEAAVAAGDRWPGWLDGALARAGVHELDEP